MKHFEYVHRFLEEIEKLFPTSGEIRHNITICKETGKLQISIYNNGNWDAVDMDKTYEDNSVYQELALGIKGVLNSYS